MGVDTSGILNSAMYTATPHYGVAVTDFRVFCGGGGGVGTASYSAVGGGGAGGAASYILSGTWSIDEPDEMQSLFDLQDEANGRRTEA